MIAFIYQNTAKVVFDCFWNSTMPGREDRQSGCHRFKHGIGNAFLISVPAGFARMQKNVRRIKKGSQLFLRYKAHKVDGTVNLKPAGERLQLLKLRTFASNGESCACKFFPESGKRTQGRLPSLLFNQPT